MRVVVVGAGIAGLGTAIALRRIGLDVVVLERSSRLTTEGSAITVWNNGLQALSRLGVPFEDARIFESFRVLHLVRRDGRPLGDVPVGRLANAFGAGAAMVTRAELVALLAAQLPASRLQFGASVVDVEEHGHGIAAVLGDGQRVPGDLLVGADGAGGATRRLFAPVALEYCRHVAWRGTAHFEHPYFPPRESFSFVGRGAYFVAHHLTRGRFYWIGTRWRDAPQRLERTRFKEEARRWFAEWIEPVRALVDATPEDAIRVNDIFSCRRPDFALRARALLVGDAAHMSAPQLGQGASLALEDAVVLADCLWREGWPRGGTSFVEARAARVARTVAASRAVADIYHLRAPALVWLRNAIVRASPPWRLLRRAGWAATVALPALPMSETASRPAVPAMAAPPPRSPA